MNKKSRIRAALLVGTALLVGCSGASGENAESERSTRTAASECPEADRVFTEEDLAPPQTYSPSCPDPEELRADLQSAQVDTTKFEAMTAAMRAGEIEEGQNPCTYPAELREAIELSDEQCSGGLGRMLARQYR